MENACSPCIQLDIGLNVELFVLLLLPACLPVWLIFGGLRVCLKGRLECRPPLLLDFFFSTTTKVNPASLVCSRQSSLSSLEFSAFSSPGFCLCGISGAVSTPSKSTLIFTSPSRWMYEHHHSHSHTRTHTHTRANKRRSPLKPTGSASSQNTWVFPIFKSLVKAYSHSPNTGLRVK